MIELEKVKGTYWTDILDQPRALRDTVAGLADLPEVPAVRQRRIVLTGMGGSYHILHPLHLRLIRSGFDCIMVETSELIHCMPELIDSRNVFVTVSQSGQSAEIVRLLERQGPLYIGVSNTPDAPLARQSAITVLTRAGEEGGVSCKTAVTSLAALHWLGEHLTGGSTQTARNVLESVAEAAETYLSRWEDHVHALVSGLQDAKRVFFAGRGSSLAAVGLGAMLQKEAAHFHGEGMSSAALRHGPFEMLGPDSFVVVFEGAANVREMNQRLVKHVLDTGAKAKLCGFSVPDGPFALPYVDDAMRPILELLPAEMMSLALGYLQGREPGKFERITKVTSVE